MNRWLGFVYRAPALLRGSRGAVLSVGLLALGAGACDNNVTAPVQFDPVRCAPEASLEVGQCRGPRRIGPPGRTEA